MRSRRQDDGLGVRIAVVAGRRSGLGDHIGAELQSGDQQRAPRRIRVVVPLSTTVRSVPTAAPTVPTSENVAQQSGRSVWESIFVQSMSPSPFVNGPKVDRAERPDDLDVTGGVDDVASRGCGLADLVCARLDTGEVDRPAVASSSGATPSVTVRGSGVARRTDSGRC